MIKITKQLNDVWAKETKDLNHESISQDLESVICEIEDELYSLSEKVCECSKLLMLKNIREEVFKRDVKISK